MNQTSGTKEAKKPICVHKNSAVQQLKRNLITFKWVINKNASTKEHL